MSRNVLHAIEESMPSFSKGQKRIAGYILANYDKAAFMTARRLGVIAHVSESTVVRFAVHLGYDGYPSMQKALQELIRGKLTSIQRIQVSHDQMSGGDVLGSVMQRDMNSIHTAIENIDRAEFDRVVELLLGAEHIYLLGVRSSAFLAGYLNFYMQLLFKNLTLVQSSVSGSIFEQLVQIGPGDVLLGISFPRVLQNGGQCRAVRARARRRGRRHHGQPHVAAVSGGTGFSARAQRHDLVRRLHGRAAEPAQRAHSGARPPQE